MVCAVDFCTTTARLGDYCRRHATDLERGRPFRLPVLTPDPEELAALEGQRLVNYLMRFTVKAGNGCRLWRGASDGAGYACVTMPGGSVQRTYRVVVEAVTGPIPPGYTVHHKCAARRCVNPDHLERSDARANIGEMLARRGFLRYIGELRDALAEHDPDHWLLASRVRVDTFDGTPDSPREPSVT
ncbi:hypothetical protein BAY60_25470 [Prauserella muralis]|uniref:HNH nuclease domain-containing protein n=1 Tax=Prauserella muralis TaxID=588067 RepID=A0A2V4AKQ1_9PSEU|nr:hypothetical protein BAY60_25470 [Prauserella muralis]